MYKSIAMKLKKNPKKDLNLKRGLYFVIGLLFLLALIYIALEWKTISDNDGYDLGYSSAIEIL
jgi:protein TonB